jgi:hypothetical protein
MNPNEVIARVGYDLSRRIVALEEDKVRLRLALGNLASAAESGEGLPEALAQARAAMEHGLPNRKPRGNGGAGHEGGDHADG